MVLVAESAIEIDARRPSLSHAQIPGSPRLPIDGSVGKTRFAVVCRWRRLPAHTERARREGEDQFSDVGGGETLVMWSSFPVILSGGPPVLTRSRARGWQVAETIPPAVGADAPGAGQALAAGRSSARDKV
jgi:hypothetical protein